MDTLEVGDVDRNGRSYGENMYDVIVTELRKENIVYIAGVAYELSEYSDASDDGTRTAVLKVYRPF